VCQKPIVDSNSNTLSLLEILEKISIKPSDEDNKNIAAGKNVVLNIKFEIVSYWKKIEAKKNAKEEVKVILYSPENKKLGDGTINFEIPTDKKRVRTLIKFEQLPISGEGEYKIEVRLKKGDKYILMAEVPFDVEIQK
jgi:hypothetical protein